MKVYELQGPDGAEGLALVDRPVPQPAAGQVLVRLNAATLNYRDLLTVKGGYGSRQKFPLMPLSDGAGVVESVGSDVRAFAPATASSAASSRVGSAASRRSEDAAQRSAARSTACWPNTVFFRRRRWSRRRSI